MKKLSALLLSLLLLLTACGTPATPGDAVTLPTPNDEILVGEGLHAEDLPEVCRLWFDLAETSGAADKNSKLPLASRADEGACDYLAVRLPDGTYTDLIQEGKLADEGVTLADFSGGGAKQEGSYGQLAWNGELYHAFTVSAADCTLPNLTAPDGGILRLNISGDCTVDGGGTEYACFEGFDCLLVTGEGALTITNAACLGCGGGDLPVPALVLDGDVTLRCDDICLAVPNTVDVPALAVLGGTLCTDMLWLEGGELVNAGGTLLARHVLGLSRAVFRGGMSLFDHVTDSDGAMLVLSGGSACISGDVPQGASVEGGAGYLSVPDLSALSVHAAENDRRVHLSDNAAYGSIYLSTTYSEDWVGAVSGASWDSLSVSSSVEWFAGTLTMENGRASELLPWGALHLNLLGENTVDTALGGTGLLLTGGGSLSAGKVNLWGWGGAHHPCLVVTDNTSPRCGELSMGFDSVNGECLLMMDRGSLHVEGETWLQRAAVDLRGGEAHFAGAVSIERGSLYITGDTVSFEHGLWLGEGDIVITGGTVIVPGGEAGLTAENGKVTISGGTVREP